MAFSPRQLRLLGFLLATLVIIADQWSKALIVAAAKSSALPIYLLPVFNLVLVFNKGVSFGMFSHTQAVTQVLLPAGLCVITLCLIFWLLRAREKRVITALGFMVGGAIGNLMDRARDGVVTDFLDFHVGSYHWPAFNVADSAIFIGVVIFLFTNILGGEKTNA